MPCPEGCSVRSRWVAFIVLTGIAYAILTLTHTDFYIFNFGLPSYLVVEGTRLFLACVIGAVVTAILSHFKN